MADGRTGRGKRRLVGWGIFGYLAIVLIVEQLVRGQDAAAFLSKLALAAVMAYFFAWLFSREPRGRKGSQR